MWFRRIATRLDGSRALADGGQITIDFQPDYQRVVVHAVDVVRNGVRTDRRKDARVQVLRREEDLDSAMFDGTHTATLTVPDLRVGDIVDYSYSVVGDNPVFGDAYYDVYTARFGAALALRRVRALYDARRPLQARVTAPGYTRRDRGKGGAGRRTLHRVHRPPRAAHPRRAGHGGQLRSRTAASSSRPRATGPTSAAGPCRCTAAASTTARWPTNSSARFG